MIRLRMRFSNSNEATIYVQVDPWAVVYALERGETIEIEADADSDTSTIEIDEHNDSRIVTLVDCDNYFVLSNGVRKHWSDFGTNIAEKE